ncbi:hypothetical protein SGPA1_20552 [Streptomyces misionensis JCM 4497]
MARGRSARDSLFPFPKGPWQAIGSDISLKHRERHAMQM